MLGAVGALAVGAVASLGFGAANEQADDALKMAKISDGMSHQWNADMMHDGIRGDVMASLYATSDQQREQYETADVVDKAKEIVENYDAAAASAPPAVARQFARVRPHLASYAQRAPQLVALAATDKAAAEAQLPEFLDLFGQLEAELGTIDDAMLASVSDAKAVADKAASHAKRLTLIAGLIALVLFTGGAIWIARSMLLPLREILAALRTVARRDLTVRVAAGDGHEFLEMGTALNNALEEISGAIQSAGQAANTLSTACEGLTAVSGELGKAANETSDQADGVSASAYEVSSNVTLMSRATDQMGSAISEIAGQTSAAANVAAEAVRATEATSKSVADLAKASEEIEEIVRAITTIAEQTNLLALNATIEAARAGESGKGFAVVATEVKELSQETGRATDHITAKISGIQAMTSQASSAIEAITDVIRRINENQSMIAAAVEQQSATTAEISRGVADIAQGAQQISGSMAAIASSTSTTSANALTTERSANQLAELASDVTTLINRFTY
jgi:methyl-accepting chemotaxis protein